MKISLLHPSRMRLNMALATAKHWLNNTVDKENYEYILSIDSSDPHLVWYKDEFTKQLPQIQILVSENNTAIDAINNAAKISTGDLLIVVSDDFECFPNWDNQLRDEVLGKKDFVLKTQDGIQPFIITIPIMDRIYYNRFGYIYYPLYQHMFCDTEMSAVGYMLDRTINSNLRFIHKHYITGAMQRDLINIKNDATWNQGQTLFKERQAKNFELGQTIKPYPNNLI